MTHASTPPTSNRLEPVAQWAIERAIEVRARIPRAHVHGGERGAQARCRSIGARQMPSRRFTVACKFDTVTGRLIPEEGKEALHSRWYFFVIMPEAPQTLLLGTFRPNSCYGHTTLSNNRDVTYAGRVRVNSDGVVTAWNDASGHYRPPPGLARQCPLPYETFRSTNFRAAVVEYQKNGAQRMLLQVTQALGAHPAPPQSSLLRRQAQRLRDQVNGRYPQARVTLRDVTDCLRRQARVVNARTTEAES